jgi:hypothetical protein
MKICMKICRKICRKKCRKKCRKIIQIRLSTFLSYFREICTPDLADVSCLRKSESLATGVINCRACGPSPSCGAAHWQHKIPGRDSDGRTPRRRPSSLPGDSGSSGDLILQLSCHGLLCRARAILSKMHIAKTGESLVSTT